MKVSKNWLLRCLASGMLLVLSLVFLEVLFQIVSPWLPGVDRITAFPKVTISATISDLQLGHRGNPKFPEHDEWGFRNRLRPARASIITMGDSHTWGGSVRPEEAWPHILSTYLDKPIYNMGLGGYGPAHNLMNIDSALTLQPKLILYGFYFGNDFADSFMITQKNKELDRFVSIDRSRLIALLEKERSFTSEVNTLFLRGRTPPHHISGLRKWFSENSRVYGLARSWKHFLINKKSPGEPSGSLNTSFEVAVKALQPFELNYTSVFEGKDWKTIFTSPYRYRTLEDTDPRIRAGVDISKATLKSMREQARSAFVEFIVVLLPTKESVFWPKVDAPKNHSMLQELVSNEDRLREELVQFFRVEQIKFIDLLQELRDTKAQPYFENIDGHPNKTGHEIIAQGIVNYLSPQLN